MKKKVMILALAGILTVSGISLAYAADKNNTRFNKFNGQMINVQNGEVKSSSNYRGTMMSMMGSGAQSDDNINKMIELMKENGFNDEANAMENRDFNAMKNNGYGSMANMMQSVGKEKMAKLHQSMMRN
ncbi:hypothetical protein [Clostridium beijerinckii]|uniref:tRNA A37 N6-isopentenylltransferase MiaA n=1 Tax=Clostridium beijerinckii TaxID=1520 RepID=A0A9Q5GMT4_CLOBE|nr:hypothetical protein [Clostridium beijerinckii]AQS05741.1 hypothetical protein CLBIJ_31830 [Clostridium beijerinckii]MBA2885370.1 tRNA A37 N6-isopentenylltransferase MiaA [Clostridium beijerinckii]MBA2900129.1 tRNA A37 N6-isopentenylltransferase MiaA [Clostridium beijerinckii]MBA2909758.1 tRNA A37 N6-isopentenylltransferase MiaA [Clostridium beijerinckii]MBA9014663.1 tRNA A37 N6-isopentenylltransferase MiaA [Clostridium beijerinckii]